jgi:hypothetical protein
MLNKAIVVVYDEESITRAIARYTQLVLSPSTTMLDL